MLWAIIWDIIWSVHEWDNISKSKDFDLFNKYSDFTDDTVMTIATADALLNWLTYDFKYRNWGNAYVWKWYGCSFYNWLLDEKMWPYNSFWNGSAMRISPIWWYFESLEETLIEAEKSSICTHNHPEWVKWAKSVAAAIFMARNWKTKEEIKTYIEKFYEYNLSKTLEEIRKTNTFNETCQGTVPESITAFLESKNFEDAIRNAISLWWDTDTIGAITGSIAEAFYWIPEDIKNKALSYLNDEMKQVIFSFYKTIWINKIYLS